MAPFGVSVADDGDLGRTADALTSPLDGWGMSIASGVSEL